ncbi:MAG: phosphoenolpyruvate--protein phosphotransferase [Anaerolineales bacterium]|nr:phosphoenolpyruvate--protein phosphotransferase [Anaerolineales bacterium]
MSPASYPENTTFQGIPASPGIALGPAQLIEKQGVQVEQRTVSDAEAELARLPGAIELAAAQLQQLKARAEVEAGAEEAAIFDAHKLLLQDPALSGMVATKVREEKLNVEAAWAAAIESFAAQMEALGDEYFRARATDIRDVGERVLRILAGADDYGAYELREAAIILARDLTPSDTIQLDKALVLGFCTAEGGPTSHAAILAKALGLPALVGAGEAVLHIPAGTRLILDADSGQLTANPDQVRFEASRRLQVHQAAQSAAYKEAALGPAVTLDGVQKEVVANIGGLEDARLALENGAEGVGLLRTEFIYLDRWTAPSEDEQYEIYKTIMELMGPRPVVARTLDVGGDKPIPYLDLGDEANPFLGWRAIRMCLDTPELFKTQLRALLRAGAGHDLRIMLPMVSTLDEVQRAKALVAEAAAEAQAAGHAVGECQLGIMVEVPAVAMLADLFAREVDFFSIGTNDLTQYSFAADRTNKKVAHLADPCHPAVLRQIARVIEAGREAGIWTGLCGEMGGDPDAAPLLLGLGLDEFSMAPALIPRAKAIIRKWSLAEAEALAQQALRLDSGAAVRELVQERA